MYEVPTSTDAGTTPQVERRLAELEADLFERLERLVLAQRPASVPEELNDRWDDIPQPPTL